MVFLYTTRIGEESTVKYKPTQIITEKNKIVNFSIQQAKTKTLDLTTNGHLYAAKNSKKTETATCPEDQNVVKSAWPKDAAEVAVAVEYRGVESLETIMTVVIQEKALE